MGVEFARREDFPDIARHLLEFSSTLAASSDFMPTPDRLVEILESLRTTGVLLVNRDGRKISGIIGGNMGPHQFNQKLRVLSEQFWWVSPCARDKGVGRNLLEAFLGLGESCDIVTVALEHDSPVPEKYLERFGLMPFERTYLKEKQCQH